MEALSHTLLNTKAFKASAVVKSAQVPPWDKSALRRLIPSPRGVDEDVRLLTQGRLERDAVCIREQRGVIKSESAHLKFRGRF